MRVVITGAAGFVGRKLAAALAKAGRLDGARITELALFDVVEPPKPASSVPITTHVGNIAAHSEGCILVGHWANRNEAKIVKSHNAFVALMKVLKPARGAIRMTILNEVEKAPRKLQHPSRPLFEGLFPSICTPP